MLLPALADGGGPQRVIPEFRGPSLAIRLFPGGLRCLLQLLRGVWMVARRSCWPPNGRIVVFAVALIRGQPRLPTHLARLPPRASLHHGAASQQGGRFFKTADRIRLITYVQPWVDGGQASARATLRPPQRTDGPGASAASRSVAESRAAAARTDAIGGV